jgi:hypothetical protein
MDIVDQGFLNAKPVKKKKVVNMVKLKEAIKQYIKKHYSKELPIVRRTFANTYK